MNYSEKVYPAPFQSHATCRVGWCQFMEKRCWIYKAVSLIPKGKVATYKQIAKIVGIKNPRLVGFYLHKNLDPKKIPCHRVIKSNGTLAKNYAFGGVKKQKQILEKERIKFNKGKTDLAKYLFKPF